MPHRWSSMYYYRFYQYFQHLHQLSYRSLKSSVCFTCIYLLHIALHDLWVLQEENLNLNPDHQSFQYQELLMHPYLYLIKDEHLLLNPYFQEYLRFSRNYISCTTGQFRKYPIFNRLFSMFTRNGSSFQSFTHCSNISRICFKIHT